MKMFFSVEHIPEVHLIQLGPLAQLYLLINGNIILFIGLAHLLELLSLDFFIGKNKIKFFFLIRFVFIRTVWAHHDRRMFVKRTGTTVVKQ
jgi:hypothetical protein